MDINIEDFVATYLGKAIDDDGAWDVQCTDLFRVYCRWLKSTYNIPVEPYPTQNGWADGYWYYRKYHMDVFDEVTNPDDFKNGDVVIFPSGCQCAPNSHICIYYNGQAFGQNQEGHNDAADLVDIDWTQALGALRPKVPGDRPDPIQAEANAVFRLYSGDEHFYTADITEANYLQDVGWKYEGVAFHHCSPEGIPLYRSYNPNSGKHMYTTSLEEHNGLINLGWLNEGVAFNVEPYRTGTAVYRLYNPNNGEHLFTTSYSEFYETAANGWNPEGDGGVGFYAD